MRALNLSSGLVRLLIGVAVLVVAAVAVVGFLSTQKKHGVAYFASVKSIYPKDHVRIKGVDVGQITAITPAPGQVRVEFSYDSKYNLPADVRAAIVSPTLVSTRFIQLTPAYRHSGAVFPDNGVIPLSRTASPLEFDDLKNELSRLATSVGPNGMDRDGALSRFLDVAARNGHGGNGQRFNDLIHQAAGALEAIDNGGGDLFATVGNLQVFVNSLGQVDGEIQEFNSRLGSVSTTLDDNKDELASALDGVSRAAKDIDGFVKDNGDTLNESIDRLGQFTRTVAQSRDNLATILHVGPNTLTNLMDIYSTRAEAITGSLEFDNLNTPADFVCSAYAEATASKPEDAVKWCGSYLGPLLNVMRMAQPPGGVSPVIVKDNGTTAVKPGDRDPKQNNAPATPEFPPPSKPLPGLGGLTTPSGGN
ncbi:MCE family protein [Pseudonocardia spinosispora]|uniref:MCE family protein n=1 Tax=Pseudonocardia spinosispora TaxID=103441 RepID=UPI0003F7484B|nr:MCE family protein [Pseudonocardia spinosispora]